MRKINSRVKYDRLKWGYLSREDFILGPKRSGIIHGSNNVNSQRQILTASLTIDQNCQNIDVSEGSHPETESVWTTYKCKY